MYIIKIYAHKYKNWLFERPSHQAAFSPVIFTPVCAPHKQRRLEYKKLRNSLLTIEFRNFMVCK